LLGFREAIAGSPDGAYVYAGGDAGKDLDIFKIDGTTLTPASPPISLGDDHPTWMARREASRHLQGPPVEPKKEFFAGLTPRRRGRSKRRKFA
jgi:hypothetical protein